jgi:hypothetical protein
MKANMARTFPWRIVKFHPRFIPEANLIELSNLWHTSRTPYGLDRHKRLVWTSGEYAKAHPETSSTAAYKDLSDMLAFGEC